MMDFDVVENYDNINRIGENNDPIAFMDSLILIMS
jgi:hypothetical protein